MIRYTQSPRDFRFHVGMIKSSAQGSVSMEYIIVSSFALLVSITTVTWLGKIVKERIAAIADKIQVEPIDLDLDLELAP